MSSTEEAALRADLCKCTSPHDTVQALLAFGRRQVRLASVAGVVRVLVEHHRKESDASARLKVALLLGLLSRTEGFSPDGVVLDAIVNALNAEKSHQVRAQLLGALSAAVGSRLPGSPAVRRRLVEAARQHLSDTYFGVRRKALELLGSLGGAAVDEPPPAPPAKRPSAGASINIVSVIVAHFGDEDPRVRTAAIRAVLRLKERGVEVGRDVYEPACRSLADDYEEVRSAAVQMVGALVQLHPESGVPLEEAEEMIRLADDAFGKISRMLTDASWAVRVRAAETLGSMTRVAPRLLEQTLDKNLMSDLRRKRTDHEVVRELYATGEFSLGRRWRARKEPRREKMDKSAVDLIDAGAGGALVHGLEDEMHEVRAATVESLRRLALACPAFAARCPDFLADMFNDEIEEVRLRAIRALGELSAHAGVVLREDQLDTALAVLPDASPDIREVLLRGLLRRANVETYDCVRLLLRELLKHLGRYPGDRNAVWECLKSVGERHPTLVLPLVPELLETTATPGNDPCCLDVPEPDPDDPAYVGVLVLVFNAARSCPTMPSLFTRHTIQHYDYLRDSLPHLVPPVRLPSREQVCASEPVDSSSCGTASSSGTASTTESGWLFLQQCLGRLGALRSLAAPGTQDLLAFAARDLRRLGELQPELAGAADFAATYLGCQLLLAKALHGGDDTSRGLWDVPAPLVLRQHVAAGAAVAQRMAEETLKLEFLYGGLGRAQLAALRHARLQARALQLMLDARTLPPRRGAVAAGGDSLARNCKRFVQEVESFQRSFSAELLELRGGFVGRLSELTPRLSSRGPAEQVDAVRAALSRGGLLLPPLPPLCPRQQQLLLPRRVTASAIAVDPAGTVDRPVRFAAGLVAALGIEATLEHVRDPASAVKVRVLYPDGRSHAVQPAPGDFSPAGSDRHQLASKVYLSAPAWTGPCPVELSLILTYSVNKGATEGTVALGEPVKVWIWPN